MKDCQEGIEMLNPYEILGVSTIDSEVVAKNKYKSLCKKYHPDNLKTGDRDKLEEVLKAWELLQEIGFSNSNTMWGHKTLFSIQRRKF